MLRTLARAALALAAFAGAATAATAQDVPNVISPLRVEMDHNGVNLVSGKTSIELPVLSVPAAPHLRFDRIQNAAPYMVGKSSGSGAEYRQSNYTVHTGQGTEAFKCFDFDCASVTGTGSTFQENIWRYRQAGSGALWNFNLQHVRSIGSGGNTYQYYASSVSYPTGETISYSYDLGYLPGDTFNRTFYRPATISSNLGYAISITYQYTGTDVSNGLWGTPSVVTLYATAAPSVPLARLTYSGNTVTDLGGRVYTCTGCTNALGSDIEVAAGTTQLPGEAAPAMTVTQHPSAQLVSSVVKDGVTWTYGYTNLTFQATTNSWLYTKLTVDGPNSYHQVYDVAAVGEPTSKRNVITKSTDSIGRATSYQFDEAYRPTLIVMPELNQVSVGYDEFGNIFTKTTTPKPGSGLAAVTETASYPVDTCVSAGTPVLCYRPTWSRDGMGRQTDYVYDAQGNLIEQTDPADAQGVRKKTYITYDAGLARKTVVRVCGDITTCGTANEVRTEYEYFGNTFLPAVERRIDAARGITLTTTYGYDAAGRLVFTDGPLSGTDDATYNRYDVWGRKTWEIGPKGANGLRSAKRFTYRNGDDMLVLSEEGTLPDAASEALTVLTRTDLSYDSQRNPVRRAISAGGTTYSVLDRSYDSRRNLICEAQRMNVAAYGSLPADACMLGAQGGQGPDRIVRNIYDAAGQLIQVQRAYGVTVANGFPATLQQNYATYEYSSNGKMKAVVDANGNRAELRYDGHDRQIRWVFPSKTSPGLVNESDYEAYGYDVLGNRTSITRRDGTTLTFAYDGLNRIIQKTAPASASGAAGYTVFYGYDVQGAQIYARFGSVSGPGVTNSYDGFGRLISSTTTMDGVARTLNSQYDSGSRRTALTGDTSTWGYLAAFAYDATGRLTGANESGYQTLQIGYDTAGRRSSLGEGFAAVTSSTAYGYDPVGRLASLTHDLAGTGSDQTLSFTYNPASQIVTRTSSNDGYASNSAYDVSRGYTVNGLNQYTAAGPATFTYDGNGNLTFDGSTYFVYDAENRLVSASGAKNATLSYDPMGRLWQVSGPSGTTRFLYDGDRMVIESDGSGNALRSYVFGDGTDEPLIWYEGTGGPARRFLHADHQGSIVAIADQNGATIAINGYDAWGVPNAGNQGRFQYTGQAWLPELGMYYYKARIYSPTLGRFLQTDSVGYKDQINLYAYVSNDPVNGRDPTGNAECDTGSRLSGGSSFCRVVEGYMIPGEGAKQGSSVVHIRDLRSPEGQLVRLMLRDPDVVAAANEAWRLSNGDRGPTGSKNEYGFWVARRGDDFIVGRLIRGDGPNIYRESIRAAHEDLPTARIFVHVHPFRVGERPDIRSIGISGLERGGGDVGVALSFKSLVVSLARPEPYTGHGMYVDWVDYYWGRDRR